MVYAAVHIWLYFENDFYMLVEKCHVLLFSSFLYPVIECRNCFKNDPNCNYCLAPLWKHWIPFSCLLRYSSLVKNFNPVPLFTSNDGANAGGEMTGTNILNL
jgi:hypothetical protein